MRRIIAVLAILVVLVSFASLEVCATDSNTIIIDGLTNTWSCDNENISVGQAGTKSDGAKVTAKIRNSQEEGEMTVVYTFTVETEGKYRLTEYIGGVNDSSNESVSNSISVCHISIDGGEEITPSYQTYPATTGYLNYNNIAVYNLGVDFELTAGEHTLTLRIDETKASSITGVQYFFKHAVLEKQETPSEIKILTSSEYVELGASIDLKVATIGSETGNETELSSQQYEVSVEGDAFSLEGTTLTANKMGSVNITVIYNEDTSLTCTKKIYTTVNGICLKSVKYVVKETIEDEVKEKEINAIPSDEVEVILKAELYNNNSETKKVCISFAGFKGEFMTRPISIVKEFAITANSPATCETLKITVSGEDKLEAFVWDSLSNPCILGNSVSLTK